ncbi:MAG: D-alanyl-D-alanine carboxypeptidase family protein [Ruminococcus sp.]|nr:D-alanyl-D-alanine carboxypeptidase family protein [Ruminococcus sp.]
MDIKIITMSVIVGLSTVTAIGMNTTENFNTMAENNVGWTLGDVNNDGWVNAVDSSIVLMEYSNLSTHGGTFTEEQKKVADVNGDGWINAVDASNILSYYAYCSTGGTISFSEWMKNPEEITTTTTTIATTITTSTTVSGYVVSTDNSSSSTQTTSTVSSIETTTTTTSTVQKISEIKLTKYDINLKVGEKDISYVTMLPEIVANKDEIWTSSDEKVATVDKWGNITGIADGKCIVTVTSVDNPEVKADINVTVGEPSTENKITEIKLSKTEMNLEVGKKDISYVTMIPDNVENKDEIWTSSDEKIATVDKWGNVTAVSDGTCTITITSVDNPKVKADIKVTVGKPSTTENKITEIKLSKTEMNLNIGEKDISYVTMLPESVANKEEIWTSSDEKIATVDKWGNVTAVSAGTCTVTVTSVDNPEVKADIKVTIKEKSDFQQLNGLTYINGILIANKSYSLPSTYDPGMDITTIKQFGELSNAAAKDGINIYLSSGYRSYSYQNTIYNNYVSWYGKASADTFSARAGHSEHQTGLAIDVNTIDDSFADTPEAEWLEKHAHEYGFIIRYPKGKESITGYKYEPWHIRYLGVEKATDVYNSGLTLEEYLGIDSYYH